MVDARGLSCPQPVLLVKRALETSRPAALEVLVDNKVALQNVTRLAQKLGYTVTFREQDGDFTLYLKQL